MLWNRGHHQWRVYDFDGETANSVRRQYSVSSSFIYFTEPSKSIGASFKCNHTIRLGNIRLMQLKTYWRFNVHTQKNTRSLRMSNLLLSSININVFVDFVRKCTDSLGRRLKEKQKRSLIVKSNLVNGDSQYYYY